MSCFCCAHFSHITIHILQSYIQNDYRSLRLISNFLQTTFPFFLNEKLFRRKFGWHRGLSFVPTYTCLYSIYINRTSLTWVWKIRATSPVAVARLLTAPKNDEWVFYSTIEKKKERHLIFGYEKHISLRLVTCTAKSLCETSNPSLYILFLCIKAPISNRGAIRYRLYMCVSGTKGQTL